MDDFVDSFEPKKHLGLEFNIIRVDFIDSISFVILEIESVFTL